MLSPYDFLTIEALAHRDDERPCVPNDKPKFGKSGKAGSTSTHRRDQSQLSERSSRITLLPGFSCIVNLFPSDTFARRRTAPRARARGRPRLQRRRRPSPAIARRAPAASWNCITIT
ncbi:hypothetical protein EVAR_88486_1 [Eumeta japonica]|uniref:Uncharacterized protein n=1 Tax=Eumeta variegata TaxID=151549 RepID=A0A4C1XR13_EUMVA|nr:hypothetical protein EVAR_88486_1 [Eumeta japonica]